jgi:hypothetical protein
MQISNIRYCNNSRNRVVSIFYSGSLHKKETRTASSVTIPSCSLILSNFMELRTSWGPSHSSATELINIVWIPNSHYPLNKRFPLIPAVSQTNSVLTSSLYLSDSSEYCPWNSAWVRNWCSYCVQLCRLPEGTRLPRVVGSSPMMHCHGSSYEIGHVYCSRRPRIILATMEALKKASRWKMVRFCIELLFQWVGIKIAISRVPVWTCLSIRACVRS